jgi:hypothetical protein
MKYLSLLLFLPFAVSSQQYYNDHQYNSLYNMQSLIRYKWYNWDPNVVYGGKDVRTAGIDTVKRFHTKHGKQTLINTDVYNGNGQLVADIYPERRYDYRYNDTLLTEMTATYKRGKTGRSVYRYDDSGNLIAIENFYNDKQTDHYRFAFSGDLCTLREYTDLTHRKKRVYVIESTYSDEGKIMSSVYSVNGEVKRTWDYSCNDKGTLTDGKKAEQTSLCTYDQQNNDGSYTVFTRTINKGIPYLTQVDYSADSVAIGRKEFVNDTILVSEYIFTERLQRYNFYTAKGKYKRGYENTLDDQQRKIMTRSIDKRQRTVSSTEITYNEKGLIAGINLLNKRRKYDTEVFEYSFDAL